MSNIWLTSDTHYSHKNIIKDLSSWQEGGIRDFKSIEAMNDSLVEGINKYVGQEDELWHLGDFTFGGIDKIWEFRKRIICKNIHLILGNHDEHIEKNKQTAIPAVERDLLFSLDVEDNPYKKFNGFSHVDLRDLFSSVQYVHFGTFGVGKQEFFLSHYAHRVWNRSHKGTIHLYGHSHDSIADYGKSMDIGVDVAFRMFGEYRPFNLDEIVKIMAKKQIEMPDHHTTSTTR